MLLEDIKKTYAVVDKLGTKGWFMADVSELETGDSIRLFDKSITKIFVVG